jgi:uroporphyrinogen decarboxylase
MTRLTKREIIRMTLNGQQPPYVPWSFKFTEEPAKLLQEHYQFDDLDIPLDNHLLNLGSDIGFFETLPDHLYKDVFGVIWDRSVDHDIGVPLQPVLTEPGLNGYQFPNPLDTRFFLEIDTQIKLKPELFRVFQIGFSLFERAWTLRGMENLLMDFCLNPGFVRELFSKIADYNVLQIERALTYDIDAIYFGDDWGQQTGLIMGYPFWKEYIFPHLVRMYQTVKRAGKFVMIHSCGDVDELFPDLIQAGVDCFNPFQPEVMDVETLLFQYRGSVCFHGGLSIQKTLPFGRSEEVKAETLGLLELGKLGGLIVSPSHAVEGDTPLENILAFIDVVKSQKNFAPDR